MVLVLHRATVVQWAIASLFVSCLSGAMALVLVTTRLGWPKVNFRLLRERALEGPVCRRYQHYFDLQRYR